MKRLFFLLAIVVIAFTSCRASGNDSDTTTGADAVKTLTDADFEGVLSSLSRPIVIDFSATWCVPCKRYAPIYHDVASQYADKADFYTVDVDRSPQLANAFGVQAVPTTVVIYTKDGNHFAQSGLLSADGLKYMIEAALNDAK